MLVNNISAAVYFCFFAKFYSWEFFLKVSASTGDARTALDVCHRAIDLAVQEAKRRKQTADVRCSVLPSLQHISMALKECNVSST